MMVVQAQLESDGYRLTAWVDEKIKAGNVITLKDSDDPHRMWRVISVSKPREKSDINTKWRVGGLA